ncbi:MAG: DUF1569 domain-containing protein [Gemmataceae bacterium]
MTATRRHLTFATLDDAVRDAERLQAVGYEKAGAWNLAQVCGHLTDWLTYPVSGFPKAPLPIRLVLWAVSKTMGRGMLEKYLRDGMPAGKPTMPQSVHPAGGDVTGAISRLREAAERFEAHDGDYLPSPLFGPLTRDEARRVQLAHCAHHLSFLVPKA